MSKLFVWDFHGVLEKGNERAVIEISNNILKQSGYSERFSTEDICTLYGKKWYEYFAYLLPHEPHEKHVELEKMCLVDQKTSDTVKKHIQPNDHIYEVLETIAKKHLQILISNSDELSLNFFMNAIGIKSYFNGTAYAAHIMGKNLTKKEILTSFLRGKDIGDIIVIDDSPSGFELASVAGGIFYLYSHPSLPFKDCEAHYRIHDLREVLREV
jgi:beta-phosphoglucomutase-like phosphatase (HAD superfamily)